MSVYAVVRTGARALFVTACLLASASPARAQDVWDLQLIVAPELPAYVHQLNTQPGLLQIIVTRSGPGLSAFEVRTRLRASRGREARAVSHPMYFSGAGVRVLTNTSAELVDPGRTDVPQEWADLAVRGGAIPQDRYELCAAIYVEDRAVSEARCARFIVDAAPPPVLLMPADGALVTDGRVTFSWAPGLSLRGPSQQSYYVRLAELRRGQTPAEALLTPPHHETVLRGRSQYLYPLGALPLSPGQVYVWQVQALDEQGRPLGANSGRSEIRTFAFLPQQGPDASLSEIPLVPGFAVVAGLHTATVRPSATGVVVDGPVLLHLSLPDGPVQVGAQARNLEVSLDGMLRVTGGEVAALGSVDGLVPEALRNVVTLTGLRWSHRHGLQASASLRAAGGTVLARGELGLGPSGLAGTLEATGTPDRPLLELGTGPVTLRVTGVAATFPDGDVTAAGRLTLAGDPMPCTVDDLDLRATTGWIAVRCEPEPGAPALALAAGSSRLGLRLDLLSGQIALDWGAASLGYDLTLRGGLELELAGGAGVECGLPLTLSLAHGAPVQVHSARLACDLADPVMDLGVARATLRDVRLDALGHTAAGWDFRVQLDAELAFPGLGVGPLPLVRGIELGPRGIAIPGLAWTEAELAASGVGALSVGGFDIRPFGVRVAPFTFPWLEWDGVGHGGWDFELDLELGLPRLPMATARCLGAAGLRVEGARFSGGRFSGSLAPRTLAEPCDLPLGGGATFRLTALDGTLAGGWSAGGVEFSGALGVAGDVALGEPFVCPLGADIATPPLGSAALALHPDNWLEGEISGLAPPCAFVWGPITASLTNGWLRFGREAGVATASVGGAMTATIDLGPVLAAGEAGSNGADGASFTVTGLMGYDLLERRLLALSGRLVGPVDVGLPAHDPVFRFRLGAADLSPDGLVLDGNHELILGPATAAVRFRRLVVGLEDASVVSGSAEILGGLGLQAALAPGHGLRFSVHPPGSPLDVETGVMITFLGDVVLGADGLAASGSAGARIAYAGTALDDLSAEFSNDFALGLSPFGVEAGWADLLHQAQRVARIDAAGIHPDMAYFGTLFTGFIPDAVPLPTLQTAFLRLRDDQGELLVVATEAEGGGVRLDTPIGQTLDLVLPALQGTQPRAPTVGVSLRDVRVSPFTFEVTAGAVAAELEAPLDLRPMGVPLVLERLAWTSASGNPDAGGLDLEGRLTFLDEVVDGARVSLRIGADDWLRGDVALDGLDHDVSPIEQVALHLRSLAGRFDLPLGSLAGGSYTLDAGLGLSVAAPRGSSLGAEVGLRLTEAGATVTSFDAEATGPDADCADFSFQYLSACVHRIRDMDASVDPAGRLRFELGIDMTLGFRVGPGRWLELALDDARLRDSGFRLPATGLTLGGPGQPAPSLELGPATLRLVGLTLPEVEVNWGGDRTDTSVGQPELTLELGWAGQGVLASGTLALTAEGLQGELLAEAPQGQTLLALGQPGDPVRLELTRVAARFPQYTVTAAGGVRFLGDPLPCEVEELDLMRDAATAAVACTFDHRVPLVGGSDRMSLSARSLTGSIQVPWNGAAPSWNLELAGDVELALTTEHRCGAAILLAASDRDGLTLIDSDFSCSIPEPRLDLGFARLAPRNLALERFERDPVSGWDFRLTLDADLLFPHLGGYELPRIHGIALDRAGFHFPALALGPSDLPSLLADGPDADLAGFGLRVHGFRMDGFTFPWFDWSGDAGPWSFALDFDLSLPGLPESAPSCLRDATFQVTDATFASGELSAALPISLIQEPGCPVSLAAGATLHLRELGGWLSASYTDGGWAADGGVALRSDVELGDPFVCGDAERLVLGETTLLLGSGGLITGRIENLAPPCPLRLGPVQAGFSDAWLEFAAVDGEQTVRLGAQAGMALDVVADTIAATGSLVLDLVAGAVETLDLTLHGPFGFGIPFEDPALSFRFGGAHLTEAGLRIDGRHELLLGAVSIGASFDEFLLDLATLQVVDGSVAFDGAFAFEAGITQDQLLRFQAVPLGTSLEAAPGALIELSGQVSVDSNGLRTTAGAAASIAYGEQRLDGLGVDFTDDFRLGFSPFAVRTGRADLLWHGDVVARMDHRGFHPELAFFASHVLPARLPLPTEAIAYLTLRDGNGDLLLDLDWNDGGLVLSTRPGQTVQLVLPALQRPGDAAPPAIGVAFSGFEVHPQTYSVRAGEILVGLPEALDLRQLGIPLALDTLRYTRRSDLASEQEGIFLEGPLVLLDSPLGGGGRVRLHIDGTERLQGSVQLDEIGHAIDLAGPVRVWLDALTGSIDVPLGTAIGQPDVFIGVAGRFEVGNGSGLAASASLEATYGSASGFQVTNFTAAAMEADCGMVDFGAVALCIESIGALSFGHHPQTGFDFHAELDVVMRVRPAGADPLEFALLGVEVRPEGFHIPPQTLNSSSRPALNGTAIQLAGASLRLLEARFPALTIGWAGEWAGVQVSDTFPTFDFELKLPSFESPRLADASITLQNVAFDRQHRLLTGQVLPYTFPDDGARLPLGGSLAVYIHEIGGGLVADAGPDGPRQGVDLHVSGSLVMPESFGEEAGELRSLGTANLRLATAGGIQGTITDFAALGAIALGPLALTPQLGSLQFAFDQGVQEVTLAAGATLTLPPPAEGLDAVQVAGDIVLDLVRGRLVGGSIAIAEPFNWPIPFRAEEPLFHLTVNQAVLDTSGIRFSGGGSMAVGEGQVAVTFHDYRFDLPGLEPVAGWVQIQSAFALELDLAQREANGDGNGNGNGARSRWSVRDPASPFEAETALRLVVPAQVTLGGQGMVVDGTSSAALNFGGESFAALDLEFAGFTLDPDPVRLTAGRADLYLVQPEQTTHVGWYDTGGFGLSPAMTALLMASLPDTLAVPSMDVGYLVLRDPVTASFLVEFERENGQTVIQTPATGLPLVLTALTNADGSHPTVPVSGSLTLDDAWIPVAGSFVADLAEAPLTVPGVPLAVTRFAFQSNGSDFELVADARLTVPGLDLPDLVARGLTFGPGGFVAGHFAMGSCGAPYSPGGEAIVQRSFGDGALSLAVHAVEVGFQATQPPTICFVGGLASSVLGETGGGPAAVGLSATYAPAGWSFALDASHLPNQGRIPLGVAEFEPLGLNGQPGETGLAARTGWDAALGRDYFEVQLGGLLHLDALLGDEFAIAVQELTFGTRGFRLAARAEDTQELQLFGGYLPLTLTSLTAGIEAPAGATPRLTLGLDGSGEFLGRTVSVSGLVLGSDGTFALASAGVNLLGPNPVDVFGEYLRLTELTLSFAPDAMGMLATGQAKMPEPLDATGTVTLAVSRDAAGQWDHDASVHFDFEAPSSRTSIGDFTLDLRAAGIELNPRRPATSRVYAVAELYEGERDQAERMIRFGRNGQNGLTPGIAFAFNDPGPGQPLDFRDFTVEWNAEFDESFRFGRGFLEIGLSELRVSNDPDWHLVVGGDARLNLDFVDGGIVVRNLVIGRNGITDWGEIQGGHLSVMETISLAVGDFSYYRGEPVTLTVTDVASNRESAANYENGTPTREVTVTEYLHFAPVAMGSGMSGCGGMAACLTMEGGIAGGVRELRFFRGPDGVSLLVDSATLSLPGDIGGHLSLRYEAAAGAGADNLIRASGRVHYGDNGFGAAGTFGRRDGELTFGLFVAASVPIPLLPAPGVLVLTDVGGGFFWRPEYADYRGVLGAANYQREGYWRDDLLFAGFLLGGLGVIQVGPNEYTVSGRTLVTVTDAYAHLDAEAVLLGMDGRDGRFRLAGGGYFYVDWADLPAIKIAGGLDMGLDFGVPLSGSGNADFLVNAGTNGTQWSVTAAANVQMLGLAGPDITADMWVGNDGLLAQVQVARDLNLLILNSHVSFLTNVWWYQPRRSVGGYAEMNANVSVLGYELAGVQFQGAVLRDPPDWLLYFAGSAFLDVPVVYSGEIAFWVALMNGDWSGGRGGNPRLEAMIAEAQGQSQRMVDAMVGTTPTQYGLTADQLAGAGAWLYSHPLAHREHFATHLEQTEERVTSPVNQTFKSVLDQDVIGTARSPAPVHGTQVATSLSTLAHTTTGLNDWITGAYTHLDLALATAAAPGRVQNPLTIQPPVMQDGELVTGPAFTAGQEAEAQLGSVREANKRRDGEYRRALARVTENLVILDAMLANRTYFEGTSTTVFGGSGDLQDWQVSTTPITSQYQVSLDLGLPEPDRTILRVSTDFRRALEATTAYNARRIGFHWDDAVWAGIRQHTFSAAAVEDANFHWARRTMPDTTRARVHGLRVFWAHTFAGAGSTQANSAGNQAREDMLSLLHSAQTATLSSQRTALLNSAYALFEQSGLQVWRDLHVHGLPAFADTAQTRAARLRTEAESAQSALLDEYRAFTTALHGVYSRKADLTSILYAMIDEYVLWRDSWDDSGDWAAARPGYTASLQDLARQLEPPRLTEIRVHPARTGSRNENLVSWTAHHPIGITENALQILPATTTSTSIDLARSVISVGAATEFVQHEARRSATAEDFRVWVRARGPAGVSATRGASYTLGLGGLSGGTSAGTNVAVADVTQPSVPQIAVEYARTIDPETGAQTYWVVDATRIPLTLSSTDHDSDIAAYEVALGTTSGGTQVRPWTVMQGRRPLAGDEPHRANNRLETSLHSLALQDGRRYWVRARTENGAGLKSGIRSVVVRVDLTPPNVPGSASQLTFGQPSGSSLHATIGRATSEPVWSSTRVATRDRVEPRVRARWRSSSDETSGVKHYEYVVSRNAEAGQAGFTQGFVATTDTTITITGAPLSYTDSIAFVLVRARDNAGQVSEPRVIRRVVRDITRPTTPLGQLYFPDTGGARFYITRLSTDPESGLLGYQWAIGTQPNRDDLRSWSNAADLPTSALTSCLSGSTISSPIGPSNCEVPPYFTIPGEELPSWTSFEGDYYVTVRAVNHAGILSHGVASGPVTVSSPVIQTTIQLQGW